LPFHYLNIPYELTHEMEKRTLAHFQSIWKVEVNEQYQEHKPEGLGTPGIFSA
jgi:hypothetical protein